MHRGTDDPLKGLIDREVVAGDRLALIARPMNWSSVRDPKYTTEPWQLLVFWNSARPVRAFASAGTGNRPANIAWSCKGDRLAFTAGETLHVWLPTEEPGEPAVPGAAQHKEVF